MNYIQYIETSQEWTCPKTGRWKVICVGGGCSGGYYNKGLVYVNGGTTSFGTFVSAIGGTIKEILTNSTSSWTIGGHGGYDGINYGGVPGTVNTPPTVNGGISFSSDGQTVRPMTAHGYGAGGSTVVSSNNAASGGAGALKTTIVDIEKDEVIPCTVGKGGAHSDSYPISICGPGADGVIILEYLGV